MGTITFNRAKRATPPAMPRGDLLLEPPPEIPPPAPAKNFGAMLRMLPMVAGALAMGIMMMSGGGMAGKGPMGGIVGWPSRWSNSATVSRSVPLSARRRRDRGGVPDA